MKRIGQGGWAKWRRRSPLERRLLLESFPLLGIARLAVLLLPFRWIAPSLGRHMEEIQNEVDFDRLERARLVGWAVRAAAIRTPWKSVCLPQAVTAQWMLRRRGIPATLYLGVKKTLPKGEALAAHAWVRCGDLVVTGAAGHRSYTVISTFS